MTTVITNQSVAPPLPVSVAGCDSVVVVPTYNEASTIESLIAQIIHYPQFRVLVVDDNSPDGTGALVQSLAAAEPRVSVLPRAGKQGLGTAYRDGFRRALTTDAAFILEMDADFSHDPVYLPRLREAAQRYYDLVLGSRYVPGGGTTDWGRVRRFISQGGNTYARTILGLPLADSTGGFRCYRRAVLETLDLGGIRSNGYAFQIEMAYRTWQAGFRIGEIPIVFPDRRVGQSKMSRKIVFEALINVWLLRLSKATPRRQ